MNGGIQTAYSGLRAQLDTLDSIANNLANASTTGFKEVRTFYSVLEEASPLVGSDPLSDAIHNHKVVGRSVLNMADGTLQRTDRPLDFALVGDGFLAVETPRGVRYTRNGSLTLNAKSQLATHEGHPVLGENGPILLGSGRIEVTDAGDVYLDRVRVDRLKLSAIDQPEALAREGSSLLTLREGAVAAPRASRAEVRQGYLEESNVNPVLATVRMVEVLRQFEAIQKSVHLVMNEMNQKSIERLGR